MDNWNAVGILTVKSAGVREQCIERALGCLNEEDGTYCLRKWKKGDTYDGNVTLGNGSATGTESCSDTILDALNASEGYIENGDCKITSCKDGYGLSGGRCVLLADEE